MTGIGTVIFSLLSGDSDITGVVAAAKIMPDYQRPANTPPFITYRVEDTYHEHHLGGASGLARATVVIACVSAIAGATGVSVAQDLAEKVRDTIDGKSGTLGPGGGTYDVRDISLDSKDDEYDPPHDGAERGIHSVNLTFTVWYRESIPTLA